MLRSDLVGTWQLRSFEVEDSPGKRRPWGENARGYMIYTSDGHVSVLISKDMPPSPPTPDDIIDSSLCYAGTYYIEGRNRIVHSVDVSSDPHRRGHEMVRDVFIEDDVLTLSGRGDYGSVQLVWERLSG